MAQAASPALVLRALASVLGNRYGVSVRGVAEDNDGNKIFFAAPVAEMQRPGLNGRGVKNGRMYNQI